MFEEGDAPLSAGDEALMEAIGAHFDAHVGEAETVMHEIISPLVHLDVHIIPPSADRDCVTLYTTGMAERPMAAPEAFGELRFAELMMQLPTAWRFDEPAVKHPRWWWPFEILTILGRYPHLESTWLGNGHTVPIQHPDAPHDKNQPFAAVLLLRPFGFDGVIERCVVDAARTVNIYSVLPIFSEELEVKLVRGSDALIDLFLKHGIAIPADPARRNVAKKRFWWF